MSLKSGHLAVAEFREPSGFKALVGVDNGHDVYLAIMVPRGSRTLRCSRCFRLRPGCRTGRLAARTVAARRDRGTRPGEIIWSAIFPSAIASAILDLDED